MKHNILNHKIKELNEIEINIVNTINDDPKIFITSNIIELSKLYFFSKSGLSRLVRKLGFKNIFDMKIFLQEQITKHENQYQIKYDENIQTRINNLMSYSNFGINETLSNIDLNIFLKIAKVIKKSNKILTFGIGSSYLATQELSLNLQKIGLNVASSQDIHNSLLKISNFCETDLVLIFSKAALVKEVVFLLEAAKKVRAKTILITTNDKITNNIDYKILLKDLGKEKRVIATSSKISQLLVADALFFEVNNLLIKKSNEYLSKSLIFLEEWNKLN